MENTEQTQDNNTQQSAGSTSGPGPSSAAQPGQELLDELTDLADKFATVVRTAWNSEQKKQVEADVRTGLSTLAVSIEEGFKQVTTSTEAKDLQVKATEVSEKVTSSKFFADLTGALTTGLRTLSDSLDKVSKDLQAKNAGAPGTTPGGAPPSSDANPGPETQDIPIRKE